MRRRAGIDAAVAAARQARTAIVFAWCETGTLDLPEEQNELIARVAAVAPRTIVVLNTGGPVLMPWKDHVGCHPGDVVPGSGRRLGHSGRPARDA